ncbi:MAG TPA: VOC family protein [Edaphobacter sp.]|jgi:PhnB protein|nr:VOC family protein [Edaphobacter sp.]
MQIQPYLHFNGNCQEAFKLYEKCLGGKIEAMMTMGEAPAEAKIPAGSGNQIMHACLKVGDAVLMASDACGQPYTAPQGFSVSIQINDPAKAERIFNELSEGGKVTMPIAQTFWAYRFGMLVDRFNIPWMINCEKPA